MKERMASAFFGRSVCLVTALWMCPLQAEVGSGDQIPPALKDIPHASGVCRASDASASPPKSSGSMTRPYDASCVMELEDYLTTRPRTDFLIVDVRQRGEYEGSHIDGALNLDVAQLSTKRYWQDKNLVLVGSGRAEDETLMQCARLKENGFRRVRVLRGGMAYWLGRRQAILGRAPALDEVTRLSASELWAESLNVNNVVILSQNADSLRAALPFAVTVPVLSEKAISGLVRDVRKQTGRVAGNFILVMPQGASNEMMESLRIAASPNPVLFYEDTPGVFAREMAQHQEMWKAQARGPKQLRCGL